MFFNREVKSNCNVGQFRKFFNVDICLCIGIKIKRHRTDADGLCSSQLAGFVPDKYCLICSYVQLVQGCLKQNASGLRVPNSAEEIMESQR